MEAVVLKPDQAPDSQQETRFLQENGFLLLFSLQSSVFSL